MHALYVDLISVVRAGDIVVHSYGRLIPHEFPIADLQQISGTDGIGRIDCTVSSGTARFFPFVPQTRNGATTTLVVNPTNVADFNNRELLCNSYSNYFYLFLSSRSKCAKQRKHYSNGRSMTYSSGITLSIKIRACNFIFLNCDSISSTRFSARTKEPFNVHATAS